MTAAELHTENTAPVPAESPEKAAAAEERKDTAAAAEKETADVEAKAEAQPEKPAEKAEDLAQESFSAFLSRLEKNADADRVKAQQEAVARAQLELKSAARREEELHAELEKAQERAEKAETNALQRANVYIEQALGKSQRSFESFEKEAENNPRALLEQIGKIALIAAAVGAAVALLFRGRKHR
jgi:hypothetical protein